jgi:alkanesulfonate monooxygenase SsuD/methylene tetrahydromethanopterin reductase-like flavin-dependent oxidoreductase (luciferase family)
MTRSSVTSTNTGTAPTLAIAPGTGASVSPAQRMRNLLETIELADQVGLDVFGIGEHHRPDFVSSSPTTILAAAAARTKRIRLTSAVTVLSSDDPVRVFQDFATLDLLSNGRAEIMAGRGSFIESFPLFGYDLKDYSDLFTEKLDLLLRLRASERVTWSGVHRPPLRDLGVYPRPVQEPLPIWIAVGGTPESIARAGRLAVVDGIGVEAPKTRLLAAKLKAMGLDSVMVIAEHVDDNLALASRNLANVLVVEPRYADPLSLVHYKKVLLTKGAIGQLEEMLA